MSHHNPRPALFPRAGSALLAICLSAGAPPANAQATPPRAPLELPAIFGEGMVLQGGGVVPVWGRSEPRERIEVRLLDADGAVLGFAATLADASGEWRADLGPLAAGGPHRLDVRSGDHAGRALGFGDVLVGEVWLGSGQSNMRMAALACDGYEEAKPGADLPELRMFLERSQPARVPQWRGEGRWVRCTPETFGDFSGALFWFGQELHAELGVPVGLMDASVGGSRIELWTSAPPQLASPQISTYASWCEAEYWGFDADGYRGDYLRRRSEWEKEARQGFARGEDPGRPPRNYAETRLRHGSIGHLFNAKIAPLAPYGLRGFLWYQGEDNARRADLYGSQLELLVSDWRARWERPEAPFCWVQLPNFYDGRAGADWPRLREEMRRAQCIPGTGMVVAIDVGLRHNIHPPDKRSIGRRFAGWALSEVYGRPRPWSASEYAGHVAQGSAVTVSFFPTYGGLRPREKELEYFELAGADGIWHAARARVCEQCPERVVVESDAVAVPLAVRYAWLHDPEVELANAAGLPVGPFTSRL